MDRSHASLSQVIWLYKSLPNNDLDHIGIIIENCGNYIITSEGNTWVYLSAKKDLKLKVISDFDTHYNSIISQPKSPLK